MHDQRFSFSRINPCLLILLATASLLAAPSVPTRDDQPLGAVPEVAGTRYCYGDAEVFSVWLKLRVKYINQTDKTLILDREIGKAWYGERVARNLEDLAAGKYEYNPNIDWFFTDKDRLPHKLKTDSPSPDFVVLSPGQMFESEIDASVVVQYENPKNFAGSIRPGIHVFQMELSTSNHPGEPLCYAQSWQQFGQLVTGVVKTEPLEIRIPSNPRVEEKCQ